PARGTLRHRVVPGEGGTMRALAERGRSGQLAVTHYRVVERAADRALLELVPETGRTHQIRVQLAAAGVPVDGDPRYDGAPTCRLMLHAASLGLKHPTTNRPLRFEAPVAVEFAEWLRDPSATRLPERARISQHMRQAAERRYGIAVLPGTDA